MKNLPIFVIVAVVIWLVWKEQQQFQTIATKRYLNEEQYYRDIRQPDQAIVARVMALKGGV